MSEKRMQIMRNASYLLPPPGGEVVRELLDSYDTLLARHNALKDAVCKVVEMHRKGEGHVCTHYPSGRRAIDALAALVEEEGK